MNDLLNKALRQEFLSAKECVELFMHASTACMVYIGDQLRHTMVSCSKVIWIIDRISNSTNVCVANCKFCNFYRRRGHAVSYVTTIDEYRLKIEAMFLLGGEQLLLQGGHPP